LSYNAGQLRTVTDPVGRTLTFTYTGSLLTSVGDSSGRQVSFDYMNGELTSATDVGNQETQFSYYAGHLLHTMQDPRGGLVSNAYYADNRVQTQTDPMSRTVQFEYTAFDSLHSQTKVTDNLGNDTLYVYDENRLTLRVENPGDPRQAVWRYTYDPNYPTGGATATDPNGHTTRNTWDSQGNLLEFDNALGLPTTYAYNGTNDLLVVTSTVNLTTTFTYDPNGNVLSITQPVKETSQLAVTQFGYDPLHPGDVLTVTNPLNNSWRTTYDSYGYVLSTTDPLTETTRFTHDPLGRLLSVVDPLTHTASLAYNPYGAVTSITDTLGYTTTYSYDANQNLQTITNTKGLTTTYTYDLGNEVTRVTYPDGTHSDTGYDGNGRVISQTNPLTQTTLYDYDAFNRLNRVTDPLTHITRYDYDLAGNLLSVTDPLTYTTYYGYDAANQLSVIKHSDGLTPDVSIDQRDTLGRITQMTDGSGTTYYSYDSLNRLVQVQNGANAVVGYQYDLANNLTRIIYPGALKSVVRGYDAANRLRTVKDWLNHTTQFDYDATGALSSQTYPNGVQLKIGRDAAGQVISMTHAITATPFLSMTYGHDKLGLLNSANEAGAGADSYTYDTRSRLVGDQFTASTPISRTWSYDGATEITATRYQLGVQTPITTTRSYDAADELRSLVEQQGTTTTKNLSFSYDDKGNRISQADSVNGTASSYSYDQANRLITYNGVWQYVYDGNGLRVKKVGLGGTTNFTWDLAAGLPLLLADGSANYIYGPGGQILEQIQGSTAYYYHADRLGSVRALTIQAGAVVATYTYDAYGATTASTGSLANPFRYTGEYQDAESGLYYLRARYYDPASQQFLTRDPLLAVTGQAYNYAGGSPLNATDPLGLAKAIPMDGGGSGGGDVVIGASVGLWTLSLWASHQLGDAAAAWLQATANTIDQAIQGNPDDDWNIVTVFRGCNGTYPGAFKLRTDRDPDGYSAFETPQPGHDIQIPFVILYRGQKVSGTEGIFLDPSLRAAGIARYTPELGGEGHWSLQFKGPDGNPISDARQLLSEYAKRMGIPNLP
jgi:RHS repeat-associated protein